MLDPPAGVTDVLLWRLRADVARNAALPAACVAQALAALHHHGLAAPLTQVFDRR